LARGANRDDSSRIEYLSQFDLLQIRTRLQAAARRQFDLLNPPGLHAALAAPRQALFGQEMRNGLVSKAAILFFRLIQNHPFYDGNKRIAVEALRAFLSRNGCQCLAADPEILSLAQAVALGKVSLQDIETWIVEQIKDK
jgi:death on curing protein